MDSVSPNETRIAGRSASDLELRTLFTRVFKRFTGTTGYWLPRIGTILDRGTLLRPAVGAGLARRL